MINQAIAALDITRVMIAHRPQTIAIARRIVQLEKGVFIDVTPAAVMTPLNDGTTALAAVGVDGPS